MIDVSEIKLKCHWHDIECPNQQRCGGCDHQPADEDKKNGGNEPVQIGWEREYDGGLYPHCPACGEMPYSLDRCIFCGQTFIKDERAEEWSKPPEIEHMDCFMCGGKKTMEFTRARSNGHKHGHCIACGARFIE